MTKYDFINRLRWFAANEGHGLPDEYGHPDYAASRGEAALSGMFARWLDDECVAMIEDVIAHWDPDKLQRSFTVGIG